MKQETREYNFDWMLWSSVTSGSKVMDGTRKEYQALLRLIPNFRSVIDALISQGEPGRLYMKMGAEYLDDIKTVHEKGKKLCFGTFVAAKDLFYAFDNVVPAWAELLTVYGTMMMRRGTAEYMDYCCEAGFTETSCSAQRGSVGAYLAGLTERPDFLICGAPGICDTNANAMQFMSEYLDIPLFQLTFPSNLTGKRITDYQRRDYKALIAFIEEHTGSCLDEDKLRSVLEEHKRQDEIINEIFDLSRLKPCPMPPIFNLFLYSGKLQSSGRKSFTTLLESMLDVVRENADHYTTDGRFWQWVDSQDISLLPTLIFTFFNKGINYAEGREDQTYEMNTSTMDAMIDSLADINSRMPMVKQLRGPYDATGMWRDDLFFMSKIMQPDLAVYVGSMGCRNSYGANKLIQRDAERFGLPTLLLFADAFDDRVASWEFCVDKISEFMHVRGIVS
ncbi:MAG: 2-hydroxyacyl-CoA dehydratase [Deltaproteobacteria bacterium HGW-Deltaproteobacteria-1]|nr:MAG: 2-hydroxyacyl-CoA dehydratase [Deltaproteobacteria bacterium HGW-Deltaproteobacteria-1]